MKILISGLVLMAISSSVYADKYVNGYTRSDGTYVQGHYRTEANDTKFDNYSTRGNTNPYTGKAGTVDPYRTEPSGSYQYGNPNAIRDPYNLNNGN